MARTRKQTSAAWSMIEQIFNQLTDAEKTDLRKLIDKSLPGPPTPPPPVQLSPCQKTGHKYTVVVGLVRQPGLFGYFKPYQNRLMCPKCGGTITR